MKSKERLTYDFGIDLGTTNSEIACFTEGEGLRIFKNFLYHTDFTPSAVWIDKKGATHVGQDAKDEHFRVHGEDNDAYIEFKKKMGKDFTYRFISSGKTMLPEELSAEVLKSLKQDVERQAGENVTAAIITVPAVFGLPECNATRKAAKLAGIEQVELLQEPVAAAYAYGLDKVKKKDVIWLVYDLGGGTFDAALVSNKEGRLRVLNHDGDRDLGGQIFDWDLVYKIIVPRIQEEYHLGDLNIEDKKYGRAFGKLKEEAEKAKIRLSSETSTNFHIPDFCAELGKKIEVDFEITRGQLESIVAPYIERTLNMCKKVLEQENLKPQDIDRLMLVGGPTLMPYVRTRLQESLGIELEFSLDPITVVAAGAAIVAHTLRREEKPVKDFEGYEIKLEAPETTLDTEPFIGGKVLSFKNNTPAPAGSTVEITRADGSWTSGKVQINENGVFSTNLYLQKDPPRNEFNIELFNPEGEKLEATPKKFLITYEVPRETTLINSIGLHLVGNKFKRYFEKGMTLPARKKDILLTTISLNKGSGDDVLNIPVCEGEEPQADLNRHIGILQIPASQIKRDLPKDSEVEVTIEIDKSRLINTVAYIPFLDQEFPGVINLTKKEVGVDVLQFDFNKLKERLKETKQLNTEIGNPEVDSIIKEMEKEDRVAEIDRNIKAAKGGIDKDAGGRAQSGILAIKERIGRAESLLTWPKLRKLAEAEFNALASCLQDPEIAPSFTEAEKKQTEQLKKEISEGLKEEKDKEGVNAKIIDLSVIRIRVLLTIPRYVVYWFQQASDEYNADSGKFTDPAQAESLIKQGAPLIPSVTYGHSTANIDELRKIVIGLWQIGFVPDSFTSKKYGSHVKERR